MDGRVRVVYFRLIGGYLTLSPEHCFVVEDENGICGYCVAAADAQQFINKNNIAWVPTLQSKYPKPDKSHNDSEEKMCTPPQVSSNVENFPCLPQRFFLPCHDKAADHVTGVRFRVNFCSLVQYGRKNQGSVESQNLRVFFL